MDKKIVYHIPYKIRELKSGSAVRPMKLYQAFIDAGYSVFLISGTVRERLQRFAALCREKNLGEYRFCYSEPPTRPLYPPIDYPVYAYLRLRGVPIGIYYRDAYWKFPAYFRSVGLQKFVFPLMHRTDLLFFKGVASAMFFPSATFSEAFDVECRKVVLPPGGEARLNSFKPEPAREPLTGIYVGGISKAYGLGVLLNGFSKVNSTQRVDLIMVCRKEEFEKEAEEFAPFIGREWLSVHHVSGQGLDALYGRAHFGVIPREANDYYSLAMPVKLFEYLSFQLPVIVTNCRETAKFVTENRIGLVCEATPESLAEAILNLSANPGLSSTLRLNVYNALMGGNLWTHRVETIERTLGKPTSVV